MIIIVNGKCKLFDMSFSDNGMKLENFEEKREQDLACGNAGTDGGDVSSGAGA